MIQLHLKGMPLPAVHTSVNSWLVTNPHNKNTTMQLVPQSCSCKWTLPASWHPTGPAPPHKHTHTHTPVIRHRPARQQQPGRLGSQRLPAGLPAGAHGDVERG